MTKKPISWPTSISFNGHYFSNAGDRYQTEYSAHYDDDGRLCLEPNGVTDLYAEIQSHAQECDIHNIINRYQLGDTEAFNRANGFYADVTNLPTSYMELLNKLNDAEAFFASLTPEIKKKFNYSLSEFLAAVDNGSYMDLLGEQEISKEDVIDEDVIEEKSDE